MIIFFLFFLFLFKTEIIRSVPNSYYRAGQNDQVTRNNADGKSQETHSRVQIVSPYMQYSSHYPYDSQAQVYIPPPKPVVIGTEALGIPVMVSLPMRWIYFLPLSRHTHEWIGNSSLRVGNVCGAEYYYRNNIEIITSDDTKVLYLIS